MEKEHKQRLIEKFGDLLKDKKLVILEIPDGYQYMDEELIQILKLSASPYLNNT
jgi:predicted protein tyrosine phosphatase